MAVTSEINFKLQAAAVGKENSLKPIQDIYILDRLTCKAILGIFCFKQENYTTFIIQVNKKSIFHKSIFFKAINTNYLIIFIYFSNKLQFATI